MLCEKMCEVLDPEPHSAPLNMAIDEVLLRVAAMPLLRIYRWARPAISLGYFDKLADLGAAARGREAVRRWTGGGVVEHGTDVTYTIVAPAGHELARMPARDSYERIHACVAAVLRAGGVATSLAPVTAAKVSPGCFENAAEADVLAAGRKVAGAAQRRTRWGLLHQGSVQGVPLSADFARRLASAFACEIVPRPLSPRDLADAASLAAEKYATEAWLRRF